MDQPDLQKEQEHPAASSLRTKRRGALELLRSLGISAAGVLTGMAFISGWLYWSTYYAAFGLNPLVLDFPIAVVSVSPVQVLVRDLLSEWQLEPGVVVVVILVVIVSIALSGLFIQWHRRRHPSATPVLFALALLMSAGAWLLATHDANLDSGCNSRLSTVAFVLITPPDPADAPPSCLNNMLTCKLVLHSNNMYRYFVVPDCSAVNSQGRGVETGEVPDDQIRMIRVVRIQGW